MKNRIAFILGAGLLIGASTAQAAWQEGAEAARYSNVELVSVDPARRVVVVKDAKGGRETLLMDDTLGSVGNVKPGDRVIITVRAGAGQRFLSAITKAAGSSSAARVPSGILMTTAPVQTTATRVVVNKTAAKEAFAAQVSSISNDAKPIDGMWAAFVTGCDGKSSSTGDGRPWFGLWEGGVQADYSTGQCRELFNQMVAAGEATKQGMVSAEASARKVLTPGEIRDIRKMSLMDWDGWGLAAPQKREP
ncbi:MAG: hypothetical protein ABI672_00700 [Vicinamibacteria bacterium]